MKKRILSLLLAFLLVFGTAADPAYTAWAAEDTPEDYCLYCEESWIYS